MPWNVVVQLGISGLVVAAGYRLAMVLIAKWAEGDKERTKVIGDGFKAIADGHQLVLQTVNASQQASLQTMNEHQLTEMGVLREYAVLISRIDSKLDARFDLTPVRGIRSEASEENTPVERPEPKPKRSATPPHGSPSLPYGIKPRPKTNG